MKNYKNLEVRGSNPGPRSNLLNIIESKYKVYISISAYSIKIAHDMSCGITFGITLVFREQMRTGKALESATNVKTILTLVAATESGFVLTEMICDW